MAMVIEWLKKRWGRFRYVVRDLSGDPYLVRYRLINTKRFGLYLHHILRSDGDRDLHDHPFDFTSVLLCNGYTEYLANYFGVPEGEFTQCPVERPWLSVIHHKADEPHRLELVNGKRVWSLVLRGPKVREWGFYLDNRRWVDWKTYHELQLVRRATVCDKCQGRGTIVFRYMGVIELPCDRCRKVSTKTKSFLRFLGLAD